MLARLNIFPSAVLTGRYSRVPFDQRRCNHCGIEPDSVTHFLCVCPVFSKLRRVFLGPVISSYSGPPNLLAAFLLNDFSQEITLLVAKFLANVFISNS